MAKIYKTCKACGRSFFISEGEQTYIKEHNLKEFVRCFDCRKGQIPSGFEDILAWIDYKYESLLDSLPGTTSSEDHFARQAHLDDLVEIYKWVNDLRGRMQRRNGNR